MSRCTLLSELSIRTRDDVAVLLERVALKCPLLKKLTLSSSPPQNFYAAGDLRGLFDGCPLIETLDFDDYGPITNDELTHLADRCTNLTLLNIREVSITYY